MLGGFNRGRCNEVECCTSEPPFVLDSTPGRKASLTYNYCPLTPVLRAPRAGTMLDERGRPRKWEVEENAQIHLIDIPIFFFFSFDCKFFSLPVCRQLKLPAGV